MSPVAMNVPSLLMPPPLLAVLSLVKVLLENVVVPKFSIPPPKPLAKLPSRMSLFAVSPAPG